MQHYSPFADTAVQPHLLVYKNLLESCASVPMACMLYSALLVFNSIQNDSISGVFHNTQGRSMVSIVVATEWRGWVVVYKTIVTIPTVPLTLKWEVRMKVAAGSITHFQMWYLIFFSFSLNYLVFMYFITY